MAARSALDRSEQAWQEASERAASGADLAAELRELRIANHFAERIRLTLEGATSDPHGA